MPVPTAITDLNTTAAGNSPPGTESAKGNIDDYLRAHAAFIAQTHANKAAKGANSDITSLSGLTTALSVAQGGTGSTTAAAARTALGATATGDAVFIAASAAAARTALSAASSGANSDITSLTGVTGVINEAKGTDIASAATINLTTATGNLVDVTGTTTVTAITLAEGAERTVRFTGALTLTHGASLVLPGSANITTAAGDFAVFRGYASGVVRCVSYDRASGKPVSFPDQLSTASGSAPSYSARAWVNFNGAGTVAIRASGNVSSITDNGVGDYTLNFTTALPNANYAIEGIAPFENATVGFVNIASVTALTTTSARVNSRRADTRDLTDYSLLTFIVVGT
jgi:hypothetical protein